MSKRKIGDNRYKFSFSQKETLNAKAFFELYKSADFLADPKNITKILSQGEELRECVDSVDGWDQIYIEGMFLKPGVPLVIKKSCRQDDCDISEQDFTFRRLSGLAAAVASTQDFVFRRIPEAEALGLECDKDKASLKLYLSAVSGAELFVDHFDVLPFICALRKFQLKKISAETVQQIADIPNVDGELTVKRLRRKLRTDHEIKEYEKKFSDVTFNITSSLIQFNSQLIRDRSKRTVRDHLFDLLYVFIIVFAISAFIKIVLF